MIAKILPHNIICQWLLKAPDHNLSTNQIVARMERTERLAGLSHRLPTYIYDLKKIGAVIESHKSPDDARVVLSYELKNPNDFNSDGLWVRKGPVRRNGKFFKSRQKGDVIAA